MPFIRKWITSGAVKEVEEYYSLRTPKKFTYDFGNRPLRSKNINVSSEQQQKLNNRNSVKHLSRIINNNYTENDIFLSLDLKTIPVDENGEIDEQQIKKIVAKFNRRLRTKYKKAGVIYKYIYVVEMENEKAPVRPHIHMLIPNFSFDEIVSCWTFGGACIRRLDAAKDYRGIANYMSKDPSLGTNHKKRWCASKNIKQPEVKLFKSKYPGEQIKPPQGYKEIINRTYASDITGAIRYIRFIKIGGADFASPIFKESRAGYDPIPITQRK